MQGNQSDIGEINTHRSEESELVLGRKRSDHAVGTVKRVVVVSPIGERISQYQCDTDQSAESKRSYVEDAGRYQRTGDMRKILHAATQGTARRRRPEGRETCQEGEAENPP